MHSDLDLGGMTFVEDYDTPLGNGQQLCEILSRSNMAVRSYGKDMHFLVYVNCDIDFEGFTLGEFMTNPWAMHNNCVKYYLDAT